MTSSFELWQKLPAGFLKKGYPAWGRFDRDVQRTVVELAKSQNFRCAFCSKDRGLIVEHDHDPEQGDGDRLTIYNIRGLTCQRCNWHLMIYETNETGGYIGWDHVDCFIDSHRYDDYIYFYECRLERFREQKLQKTCPNYWSRTGLLDKFDDWKECCWRRQKYPWRWGFEEIKAKRHGKIRTPGQFFKYLTALTEFILEQEKDPNWRPSDKFLKAMFKLKPFLDKLIAELERARGPRIAKPGSNRSASSIAVIDSTG
ncbi:MAG TPA: endonuclease domain-containing protein [Methylocella sp.]|nr:endonuclease domain-containing protein [Methylocella sp.]